MRVSTVAILAGTVQTALGCTFAFSSSHNAAYGGNNNVRCVAEIWASDDVDFYNDNADAATDIGCQGGCHDLDFRGQTYTFCFDRTADNRFKGRATVQRKGGELVNIIPDGETYDNSFTAYLGSVETHKYYRASVGCP